MGGWGDELGGQLSRVTTRVFCSRGLGRQTLLIDSELHPNDLARETMAGGVPVTFDRAFG